MKKDAILVLALNVCGCWHLELGRRWMTKMEDEDG